MNEQKQYIEVIAQRAVIDSLMQSPSNASLEKAKGILTARGVNSMRWPELREKYPELSWGENNPGALLEAYWMESDYLVKFAAISKAEKGKVDSFVSLFAPVFRQEADKLNEEVIRRAIQIYFVIQPLVKKEDQINNPKNNNLLVSSCLEAAKYGKLTAWRFVCMPKTDFNPNDLDLPWKVTIGDARYDTLTPALPFDQGVVDALVKIRIGINITYVFDDWELPFLRVLDLNTGESPFMALSPLDRARSLVALETVKKSVKKWIVEKLSKENIPYEIIFFSDLIPYQDFKDGVESLRFDTGSNLQGVFRAEEEFVRKADPYKSDMAVNRAVSTRIAQYAFEGIILREYFGWGIFLASEYPINTVWQKLSLFTGIPTLFYVTDRDVKNI